VRGELAKKHRLRQAVAALNVALSLP
jgi:hypothetical protein